MPNALVLDAPPARGARPGPELPCILYPAPWERRGLILFSALSALCRGIHRRREGRALRLEATRAAYCGSDSFPAFKVFFGEYDAERFAFTVAGVGADRELLQRALAVANPDTPQESSR